MQLLLLRQNEFFCRPAADRAGMIVSQQTDTENWRTFLGEGTEVAADRGLQCAERPGFVDKYQDGRQA